MHRPVLTIPPSGGSYFANRACRPPPYRDVAWTRVYEELVRLHQGRQAREKATVGVVLMACHFLGTWHLDVRMVEKADRFTDVLLLLAGPDVPIRIEKLAQLGQEDIARQPDNPLDDSGYRRAVGVGLDDDTTILDTLVRSRLVLSDAQLVHPLLRVIHELDIVLVGLVEVRKAIPLVPAVT